MPLGKPFLTSLAKSDGLDNSFILGGVAPVKPPFSRRTVSLCSQVQLAAADLTGADPEPYILPTGL